ncbi:uncharacterized protein LOC112090399 isoform X1 [Morus notabilis]|uniref:uncharacterized protein LOC112090399 isoform X1 n=1 Tax=Morus notabilis TaxID=981085 RepID=UPI000CED174C|nr:uncharacterized protein LOC112090399 isoform X1 [Morus notabilis]XP_024017361.1 uncharacterized protein LOC112090399 isoform X1 [Morus notabilis]
MAKKLVKYSVVDAFTDSPFKGNQAAVCLLEEDRDDEWLQSVAAEFHISETCYLTRIAESEARDSPNGPSVPRFRLRWFTPVAEVKLCGHATIAAAQTLFTSGKIDSDIIEFDTLSGILTAEKVPAKNKGSDGHEEQIDFFIELNFPADPNTDFNSVEDSLISKALGGVPVIDIKRTTTLDYLIVIPPTVHCAKTNLPLIRSYILFLVELFKVVVPSAKSVEDLWPDFDAIGKFPGKGIIVTGIAPPASGFDFYSRFFAPKFGINEDPVTGSAHCSLASYWRKELGKCDFVAYQASPRGGVLNVHLDEQSQRVLLRGKAFTVMEGTLLV